MLQMIGILQDSSRVVIHSHDDLDGLMAGEGMALAAIAANHEVEVTRQSHHNLNPSEIQVNPGETHVFVDLAPNECDMPPEDPRRFTKPFTDKGAKVILLDHHKDRIAYSLEDAAILDTKIMEGEDVTATGLVDELHYLCGNPGFHQPRLPRQLARTTDGLVKGPQIDALASSWGSDSSEFKHLTYVLTMMATGELDKLVANPDVWPAESVPEFFTSDDYKTIPQNLYLGIYDMTDLSGSELMRVPLPVEYDELTSEVLEAAGDSKGIVLVLDDYLGPQVDGILASVLEEEADSSQVSFIGVFQKQPGGNYSFKVRSNNGGVLTPLLGESEEESKLLHAGRNIYVSTRRTQPLTGEDVDEFLAASLNQDFYVASTSGVNQETLNKRINRKVAEALQ